MIFLFMFCMKLNVQNKGEVNNMIDDLVEKETFTKTEISVLNRAK